MNKGSDICPNRLRDEAGVSLVEIMVAATMLVIVTIGVFGALEAAGRAGAEERYRSQAYQVAQEDQARLRTLKVTALTNLNQTRTVTQDGTPFTINSTSQFTTDATGTQSCDTGTASADYLKISTTVTWPSMGSRPAVSISSIIAPPNGSFEDDRGALAVAVRNAAGVGIPSIGLSGTGAGTFSGATGANGCAVFANLPEGNYTLTPSASGYVDKDGIAAGPVPTSVVSQTTNSIALQLDRPGSIETSFFTRLVSNGTPVASSADTVMVDNTGMTAAKSFGTVGNRVAKITASSLFPFTSPDLVYAGACEGNNPGATTPLAPEAYDSVQVAAGGPMAPASVILPSLNLTVRSGTSSSSAGSLVNNARVTLTDRNCSNSSGVPIKRVFATNSSGKLADPGVPYSAYDVCVSNTSTGTGNPSTIRRVVTSNLAIKSTTIPTNLTVYLGATGSISGACP